MTEKLLDTVKKLGFTEKEVNEFCHEVVKAFSEMADVSAGGFLQQFCEDEAVTRKLVLTLEITRHADGEWTFFREKVQWPRLASCTVKDLGVSTWNPAQLEMDFNSSRLAAYQKYLADLSAYRRNVTIVWPAKIYLGNEDSFTMNIAIDGRVHTEDIPEAKWELWADALKESGAVIYTPEGALCEDLNSLVGRLGGIYICLMYADGIAHGLWNSVESKWDEANLTFEDVQNNHGILSSLPED